MTAYDGLDQCPDTPKGATVDAKGCRPTPIATASSTVSTSARTRRPARRSTRRVARPTPTATACTTARQVPEHRGRRQGGRGRLPDRGHRARDRAARHRHDPSPGRELRDGQVGHPARVVRHPDDVGAILRKWPTLQIEVGGPTDLRGTASSNQSLSEARAKRGARVPAPEVPGHPGGADDGEGLRRIEADRPEQGRVANLAKNRRVEFVVRTRTCSGRKSSTAARSRSNRRTKHEGPALAPRAPGLSFGPRAAVGRDFENGPG